MLGLGLDSWWNPVPDKYCIKFLILNSRFLEKRLLMRVKEKSEKAGLKLNIKNLRA